MTEARLDVPIIGEPDASPRVARDVGVSHDEIGRPQDAGAAACLGVISTVTCRSRSAIQARCVARPQAR